MSIQSFKEMLSHLEGEYTLDFTQKDDCDYFVEKYGGEDALRSKYPAIYSSFNRTRQAAEQGALQNNDGRDPPNTCPGMLYGLDAVPLRPRARMMAPGALDDGDCAEQYGCLTSLIGFDFIDSTKAVNDTAEAEEWIGVTVETKIREVNSSLYLVDDSFVLLKAHSYHDYVESAPDSLSLLQNRRYNMRVEVTGVDPAGKNVSKIFSKTFDVGDVESVAKRNIADVTIEDPHPKSAAHIRTEEIMMLYGRLDELAIYADADYKGGDFLKNTFSDGKVRLLMPLKGKVTYNAGVKPLWLYEPEYEIETLLRPRVTYDSKDKSFEYYGTNKDDKAMHSKMLGCFTQSEYRSDVPSTLQFDFAIADTGRSVWDWHIDLDGLPSGNSKTLYLDQGFTYCARNQLGRTVKEQIIIKSVTKENLKALGREYYKFVPGVANVVYIPPITIYWGCFGRDTRILLADKTEKNACDIAIGDQLAGVDGKVLTVDNVLTGHDATICRINTKGHGSIMVSVGHPMLCGGEIIRACDIAAGHRLDMPGGASAAVVSTETIDYNDTVYNFTFAGEDAGAYLIANGFYSGDLRLQNQRERAPERIFTQEEKQIIAEAMLYNEERKARRL